MEGESNQLIVFTLDEQRYALHLSAVERVFRVVEITPLPKAPEIVLGVINIQGRMIPLLNIRRRFRLPERDMTPSDQLILASTGTQAVALVVDAVNAVVERSKEEVIAADSILPDLEYVKGVAKLEDGLILIHDLGQFLSLEEEKTLNGALKAT